MYTLFRSDHYPSENILSEKQRWPVTGKKRGRPSGKGTDAKEWVDTEIFKLIELWEKKDILYNTKHLMYYNKEERDSAVREIQKVLSDQDIHATLDQITDKMTNLKCYYGSQKRNMENMKLNGGDGNYVSPWKFFNDLQFLNGHFLQRTPTTRRRYIVNHHQQHTNNNNNNNNINNNNNNINNKLMNGKISKSEDPHLHQFPYEGSPNPPPAKITVVDPYIIHQPKATMIDPYGKVYLESPTTVTIKPYNPNSHHHHEGGNGYWDEGKPPMMAPPSPPYTNGSIDRKRSPPPTSQLSRQGSTGSPSNNGRISPPKLSPKSEDDCFSELICKMLNQIPESEEKAMLRLEMQQKVIALRYRT